MSMKKRSIALLIACLLFVSFSKAQSESDSLLYRIDSILFSTTDTLFTNNDTLGFSDSLFLLTEGDQFIPGSYIPDSIYMKRLSALPFTFEMTYNPTVRRFIELYTVKLQDKLSVMLGLSSFYFPIFEAVLDSFNYPQELKYLPVIESALNPAATSKAHAAGLWQFIRSTGLENGLVINGYMDERRGIQESTIAAIRYLGDLYAKFNDWQLALAAYNCGPGNVNRAIARSGGKRSFWEIYKYLPRETRGYVPGFIGAAYAFNYYKAHGIAPVPSDLPEKIDTIKIDRNLHFKQVAEVLCIDLNTLKMINPQYIKDFVPSGNKKQFVLNLPATDKERFVAMRDSIFAYNSAFYQKECENLLKTPDYVVHRVKYGECMSVIAQRYHVSVSSIKKWNRISGTSLRQGQKLVIYPRA
jgi:membrane-bound lytic murein transglycosylase D